VTLHSLDRWKAFGLHLAISALLAATVVVLVVLLWYPPPYFQAMGGEILLRLLIGVDVVLGPLITLIIFDPKKPRLKYDLACIAVMQLAALAYGGYVMFDARPVYSVFVKDRFETVAANAIDDSSANAATSEYREFPMSGPRIVAAKLPTDPQEVTAIAFMSLKGGPDVSAMPHLYVPYGEQAQQAARAARPLVALSRQSKESSDAVTAFVAAHGDGNRSLGYIPAKARNRDFSVVVDRKTGEVVGYLPINPW
jgi:hypothetical protein